MRTNQMPITLAEILQITFDLVQRAERAEARVKELEACMLNLQDALQEAQGHATSNEQAQME